MEWFSKGDMGETELVFGKRFRMPKSSCFRGAAMVSMRGRNGVDTGYNEERIAVVGHGGWKSIVVMRARTELAQ